MRSNKLIMILIIASLLIVSGCKKSQNPQTVTDTNPTASPSATIIPTAEPGLRPSQDEPVATPALSLDEESLEAYEKFLKNEAAISFDRFMHKGYLINPDNTEEPLFQKETEYTLLELLERLTRYYLERSTDKKLKSIDYGFIDCGKDGVSELVLRFNGMDIDGIDDDSTLVYVIKYINGKLYLCYYYETWARSETSINEYGYIKSSGSGGASHHISEYSFIDKAGNWHQIAYIDSESDIYNFGPFENLAKLAEAKGIKDIIQIDTIRFNYDPLADQQDNGEVFYTFYVFDENWEPVEDANLYTNSVYKEIFDESNMPFITPDELSAMIAEKEQNLGVTAEIKEGGEVSWKALSGDLFSQYVER